MNGQPVSSSTSLAAWDAIANLLKAASWSDLARKTGLHPASISRARRDPRKSLSENERRKLLRTLAYHFTDHPSLLTWLKEIGWALYFGDEAFLAEVFQDVADLPDVHRLPRYLVRRPEMERQVLEAILPHKTHRFGELPHIGIVVSGIGGIGKSTLVRAALRRQGQLKLNFPDGIYWINCARLNEDQVLQEILYDFSAGQGQPFQNLLPVRLRQALRGRKVLFVLDGVESQRIIQTVLDQLPHPGCRFIFTIRQQLFTVDLDRLRLTSVTVSNFSADQAMQLVKSILYRNEDHPESEALSKVIERVEAHPMAIESLAILVQAAALTWEQVLEHLEKSPMGTLSDRLRECFDLTYERLAISEPAAALYFRAMGVFPQSKGLAAMLDIVSGLAENERLQVVRILAQYNLIRFYVEDGVCRTWETHVLLSDYAAEQLARFPEEEEKLRQRYFDALLQSVEDFNPIGYDWPPEKKTPTDDQTRESLKLLQVFALYDEILLRARTCLERGDLIQALRLLTGSSFNSLIMAFYMKHIYLLLEITEREYCMVAKPNPDVLNILKEAASRFKAFLEDIQANDVKDLSELPVEESFINQFEWLNTQGICHLLVGDIEGSRRICQKELDLIPKLPENELETAWHMYYCHEADFCFLEGDREGGIKYYLKAGIIQSDDELETESTYQMCHGWPIKRMAILRQVITALIGQPEREVVAKDEPDRDLESATMTI